MGDSRFGRRHGRLPSSRGLHHEIRKLVLRRHNVSATVSELDRYQPGYPAGADENSWIRRSDGGETETDRCQHTGAIDGAKYHVDESSHSVDIPGTFQRSVPHNYDRIEAKVKELPQKHFHISWNLNNHTFSSASCRDHHSLGG